MKILVALLAVLAIAGCSDSTPSQPSEYDKYEKLCHDKGGAISVVDVGWSTVTYRCIGDAFTPLLPDFSA